MNDSDYIYEAVMTTICVLLFGVPAVVLFMAAPPLLQLMAVPAILAGIGVFVSD